MKMSNSAKPCPCYFCENRRYKERADKQYQWASLKEWVCQPAATAQAEPIKPKSFAVVELEKLLAHQEQQRADTQKMLNAWAEEGARLRINRVALSDQIFELRAAIRKLS
jgi:hypothetical protein